VADAAMAVGRLDAATDKIPNPSLLVRSTLAQEATSTTALEGTYAPLTDVLEGEILGNVVSAEAAEVLNYIRAADLALELLKIRPISLNILTELQKTLVGGTRGDAYDAGELRRRQVIIGPQGAPIERSRFVPPPPQQLVDGFSKWEQWIHSEAEIHLLVRACLGHYQFETLHPFSDGNGRLGRLVVSLQLIEGGALRFPLLNIAEWLEPRKDEYQDRLLQLSMDGDFSAWVQFFASGIHGAAETAIERIDRLLGVRQSQLDTIRAAGSRGGVGLRIVEELIGYPIINVPYVSNRYQVTFQAANQAVARLEGVGILTELKDSNQKRRVFYSPAVLRALAGRPPPQAQDGGKTDEAGP
jgi:Fic family protein